jgi:hypothetical protein
LKNKSDILNKIFDNDPFGLLKVKPKSSSTVTSEDRLVHSFDEINNFIKENNREPKPDPTNISEYKLYSTLKGMRENEEKMIALKSNDKFGLLNVNKVEINSIDDILSDDSLDILGDDLDLFNFKHTPKDTERFKSDFIGKRFKCKDFDKYEHLFKEVQEDLALGKRKLVEFKLSDLKQDHYYVHNGMLFLLEKIYEREDKSDVKDTHKDGRTRCIFENGTESNILYRTVGKNLSNNGKSVTQNIDKVIDEFDESFGGIVEDDKETGHIYVASSLSNKKEISTTENLYKIGYSTTTVEQRIRNAENDPTYLMAPVKIVSAWKCFNMNTQKFEQLIQRFFGKTCLDIDVFDNKGKRHRPREWFIVPLEVIEQVIVLIISGEIVNYRYDEGNQVIILK